MRARLPARVSLTALAVLCVTLLASDLSRAGKRARRGSARGKVVVPAWVQGLVTKDTPVLGAARPDLVVVEFSDYQCPFCVRAHAVMLKVLKKHGHRIRFYYRHYPLDNACNTTMKSAMHPHACLAARAAICAHAQGRFWSFHDRLYGLRAQLSQGAILGLVRAAGLRQSRFNRCLRSARTRRILQADLAAGNRAKLVGTPTFYAGGPYIKRFELSNPTLARFDQLFTTLDKQRQKRRP